MSPKEQQTSDNLIFKDNCFIIEIFDKRHQKSPQTPVLLHGRVLKLLCANLQLGFLTDLDKVERFTMFVNVRKGCI